MDKRLRLRQSVDNVEHLALVDKNDKKNTTCFANIAAETLKIFIHFQRSTNFD